MTLHRRPWLGEAALCPKCNRLRQIVGANRMCGPCWKRIEGEMTW